MILSLLSLTLRYFGCTILQNTTTSRKMENINKIQVIETVHKYLIYLYELTIHFFTLFTRFYFMFNLSTQKIN